jgi:hypothetical protein
MVFFFFFFKDENAVNLVYALLGLQDNFDLDGFSEKRQGAMNALVSCAPRKAPPSVLFFILFTASNPPSSLI